MHIEDLLGWQKTRIQTIGAAQNELVRHMGDFRKHLLDEESRLGIGLGSWR